MKRALVLVALIVASCAGGATPSASTVSTAAAVASATPKPTATPRAATPTPTPDNSLAVRLVERLDELGALVLTGDGELTAQWGLEEGDWITANDAMATLMADPATEDYVDNVLALLGTVSEGGDQTAAIATLIEMRNTIATSIGLPTEAIATPEPTAKPTPTPPIEYAKVSKRTWAKIVKSPDNYTGEGFRLWACIFQFDAATGSEAFLANASYTRLEYWSLDGDNTQFTGAQDKLEPFVEDDIVQLNVVSEGSYSYDTQAGGNTTVPTFRVSSIKRVGSCE